MNFEPEYDDLIEFYKHTSAEGFLISLISGKNKILHQNKSYYYSHAITKKEVQDQYYKNKEQTLDYNYQNDVQNYEKTLKILYDRFNEFFQDPQEKSLLTIQENKYMRLLELAMLTRTFVDLKYCCVDLEFFLHISKELNYDI